MVRYMDDCNFVWIVIKNSSFLISCVMSVLDHIVLVQLDLSSPVCLS
jgi:hypothetical protein